MKPTLDHGGESHATAGNVDGCLACEGAAYGELSTKRDNLNETINNILALGEAFGQGGSPVRISRCTGKYSAQLGVSHWTASAMTVEAAIVALHRKLSVEAEQRIKQRTAEIGKLAAHMEDR